MALLDGLVGPCTKKHPKFIPPDVQTSYFHEMLLKSSLKPYGACISWFRTYDPPFKYKISSVAELVYRDSDYLC